jgi:hypothetical protein
MSLTVILRFLRISAHHGPPTTCSLTVTVNFQVRLSLRFLHISAHHGPPTICPLTVTVILLSLALYASPPSLPSHQHPLLPLLLDVRSLLLPPFSIHSSPFLVSFYNDLSTLPRHHICAILLIFFPRITSSFPLRVDTAGKSFFLLSTSIMFISFSHAVWSFKWC